MVEVVGEAAAEVAVQDGNHASSVGDHVAQAAVARKRKKSFKQRKALRLLARTGGNRMRIRKKDIGDNLAWALQSLPLFDDLFLGMQAMNLGMVHEFLLEIERNLLRELLELERTPPHTIFVSAVSQLWVFGVYELLRTWRQRADEVLIFAVRVSRATGNNRRKLLALKRSQLLGGSAEPLSSRYRWSQFRKAATDTNYGRKLREAIDRHELIFRRLEALRVSLAKHELPKQRGMPAIPAMMPGYGRIDEATGSIRWEYVLQGREVDALTRRGIAEQCLMLAKETRRPILKPEIQKKIQQFSRAAWHSYGVHRLVVTLRDGREQPGVYVAWCKEVIGVHGHPGIPFKLDDVVDVRLM